VLTRARQSSEHREQLEDRLASHDVPLAAVERAREFYDDALAWLDDRVESYLDEEFGRGWRADPATLSEQGREIPLRDPETVETDDLTEWAESAGYTGEVWRSLSTVGLAVEDAIDDLGVGRTPVCTAVGAIMGRWYERDHASYLREIELEASPADERGVDELWQTRYTAGLVLFECMPGDTLQEVFDELGGVVMSATLEPLDVFREVAGLGALSESGRPVVERSYELPFPESNRASWLVDAEPFTARNRGDPGENTDPEAWNRTRDEYAHVLRTLARSPGNVLLAMPNYREAAWAGEYLADVVEKPVLIDESSANEATERLKQRFFGGEGKVLVTSTRGTLTEGVDYDGTKLHCCGVVGVPLVNIGSPRVRAVQRAYADAFGEDRAFEYALTVPAVRRARQAIGRVVRGVEEVGVRALVGRRYVPDARHSVHAFLAPGEREEFRRLTPEFLPGQLDRFWDGHPIPFE
jgi:DNA excision repair protein ERCC-2